MGGIYLTTRSFGAWWIAGQFSFGKDLTELQPTELTCLCMPPYYAWSSNSSHAKGESHCYSTCTYCAIASLPFSSRNPSLSCCTSWNSDIYILMWFAPAYGYALDKANIGYANSTISSFWVNRNGPSRSWYSLHHFLLCWKKNSWGPVHISPTFQLFSFFYVYRSPVSKVKL